MKPWLEEWAVGRDGDRVYCGCGASNDEALAVYDGSQWRATLLADARTDEGAKALAALAAAAPALVRALLDVEWQGIVGELYDHTNGCAVCKREGNTGKHAPGCPLDAALTAAGLPDQTSRDEARRCISAGREKASDGAGMRGGDPASTPPECSPPRAEDERGATKRERAVR